MRFCLLSVNVDYKLVGIALYVFCSTFLVVSSIVIATSVVVTAFLTVAGIVITSCVVVSAFLTVTGIVIASCVVVSAFLTVTGIVIATSVVITAFLTVTGIVIATSVVVTAFLTVTGIVIATSVVVSAFLTVAGIVITSCVVVSTFLSVSGIVIAASVVITAFLTVASIVIAAIVEILSEHNIYKSYAFKVENDCTVEFFVCHLTVDAYRQFSEHWSHPELFLVASSDSNVLSCLELFQSFIVCSLYTSHDDIADSHTVEHESVKCQSVCAIVVANNDCSVLRLCLFTVDIYYEFVGIVCGDAIVLFFISALIFEVFSEDHIYKSYTFKVENDGAVELFVCHLAVNAYRQFSEHWSHPELFLVASSDSNVLSCLELFQSFIVCSLYTSHDDIADSHTVEHESVKCQSVCAIVVANDDCRVLRLCLFSVDIYYQLVGIGFCLSEYTDYGEYHCYCE